MENAELLEFVWKMKPKDDSQQEWVEKLIAHDPSVLGIIKSEIIKCRKDPVYMYENYWRVNGYKPMPLRDIDKQMMRGEITEEQYFEYWRKRHD